MDSGERKRTKKPYFQRFLILLIVWQFDIVLLIMQK